MTAAVACRTLLHLASTIRLHQVLGLFTAGVLMAVEPASAGAQVSTRDSTAKPPVRVATGTTPLGPRRTMDAAAVEGTIRLDGVLDEPSWSKATPATDFVQSEPLTGEPATEETEARVLFDDEYLYVGATMRDSDPNRLIVSSIKKDFDESDQDDFEVLLDTFGDRRNAYVFSTNVEGAKHDRQVALEGREINTSWDAVWDVSTKRTAEGWTVEMRIPFRSLRFDRSANRVWGINFSRHIRRKNEVVFWSPVPRAYNLNRVSLAGELAGLQTGSAGRDIRVKPYVLASTVRPPGTTAFPYPSYQKDADVGLDVKASITSGITMDLTVNPDFAQAEADEQQVNLTQFSQFYPEKRDFFLENSGIFYVGDAARNNRVNPTPTPDEDNLLFFSRRIGLTSAGQPVPIAGGIRLTGKLTEQLRAGVLTIREREDDGAPSRTSSVLRLRQNLGTSGHDVGVIFLQRENTSGPAFRNRVYGIDNNFRLFGNLDWNSYYIKSETPGITSGDYAWRSTLNWEGNFFHGKGGVMEMGDGFQNDLGYYRRIGTRKWLLDTGIRPRYASLRAKGIREMHPHVRWEYYEDLDGRVTGKNFHDGYSFFFNNSAVAEIAVNRNFQRITAPLRISSRQATPIPAGGYGWTNWSILINTDQAARFSINVRAFAGGLWTGDATTINGSFTIRPTYRLNTSFGIQRTDAQLDLPDEHVVTSVYTARANYSFSTNMFVDALSQYDPNSKQLSANVRFNLIHHPLSDLFIVYNDQRFVTSEAPFPGRSLAVKFTQMVAF